ncbi:hypothetical protein BCT23_14830 [Enterovibrio norvegicus]|uniref:Uncharacterized protein n=1 Tax=Enterovibrio norvegicus TaxID=188144 RepID=A0A2N7LAV0_9GAMM|nr:hypothetical protein BCT23_14830 [Enterovibrio norvegicus]
MPQQFYKTTFNIAKVYLDHIRSSNNAFGFHSFSLMNTPSYITRKNTCFTREQPSVIYEFNIVKNKKTAMK